MSEARESIRKTHNSIIEVGYGVFTIDLIYSPSRADADTLQVVTEWALHIAEAKPLCLFCNHQWTSLKQTPPAALAIIKSRCDELRAIMVTSICRQCDSKYSDPASVLAAVVEKYKQIDPDLRPVGYTHKPMATRQ
jgi:hypothetical protein